MVFSIVIFLWEDGPLRLYLLPCPTRPRLKAVRHCPCPASPPGTVVTVQAPGRKNPGTGRSNRLPSAFVRSRASLKETS